MVKHKRGQMEAFGLAIIVILIALGMFFVLRFTILAPQQNVKQDFVRSQLAENMVNAIINIKQEPGLGKDMNELMKDCAEQSSGCGMQAGSSDCGCADKSATCLQVENAVSDIFSKTLDVWKKNYMFKYPNTNECIIQVKKGECKLEKDVSSGYIVLTEGNVPKPIYFELCDQ